LEPEDNRESDFCRALEDSPNIRAAMAAPGLVLIIM
jgi:hypothetical protein